MKSRDNWIEFNRLLFNLVTTSYIILGLALGLNLFGEEGSSTVGAIFKWLWILLYVFLIMYIYNAKEDIILLFKNNFALLALVILLPIASIIWSEDRVTTLSRSIGLIVPVLYAIVLSKRCCEDEIIKAIYFISSIIIVSSIIVVTILPTAGLEQDHHEGLWRGVFMQKNLTGRFFCFLLIVSYFSFKYLKKSKIDIVMMVLSVFFILKSGSATALLVGIFCIILTSLLIGVKKVRQKNIATIFVLVVSVSILSIFISNVTVIFESLGKDTTFSGRTIIWPKLIEMLSEDPFLGFGYGAFWENGTATRIETSFYFTWIVNHAHNGFLELLLDMGILGMILFISVTIFMLKTLKTVSKEPNTTFIVSLVLSYTIFTYLMNITQIFLNKQNSFYWCFFVFLYCYIYFRKNGLIVKK